MYSYFYDAFLSSSSYGRELGRVESRLQELHIEGKITRSTFQRNLALKEWFDDELRRGVKTVVAVGNDHTLHNILIQAANTKVVVGFIPLGGEQIIAPILHIPLGLEACNAISRRFIKKFRLGRANTHSFLAFFKTKINKNVSVSCDHSWSLSPRHSASLTLFNVGPVPLPHGRVKPANGEDDILEGSLVSAGNGFLPFGQEDRSVFFASEVQVRGLSGTFDVQCDGERFSTNEALVSIAPQKVSVIVGSGL